MASHGQGQPGMPTHHMMSRSPPPKFRPCMIIIVVMSLGLLFIGLTLTIIAHWPGYTAIGANPLKIVGPVLLSVGGVVFVGCIVEVVRKNTSEKKSFSRQMQERERMMSFINRTQRSLPSSSQYSIQPQPNTQPARGILKSQNGSQYGDSGVATRTYNSSATNMSYEPERGSQGSNGRYEVHGGVNPMPDPNYPAQGGYQPAQGGYQPNQGGYQPEQGGYQPTQGGYQPNQGGYQPEQAGYQPDQGGYQPTQGGYQPNPQSPQPFQGEPIPESDTGSDVPQPVRTRTKDYKKKATAHPQYTNGGYQMDNADPADFARAQFAATPDAHRYPSMDGLPELNNSSSSEIHHQADIHGIQPQIDNDEPLPGGQDRDAKRRRRQEQKRRKEAGAMQGSGNNDPMHISIKTTPGVQVTITPTGTPNMNRHNSAETDI